MGERAARRRRARSTIIYDGKCPVCAGTVQWLRDKGLAGSFELLECRSEQRRMMHPEVNRDECMRAIHLVLPDGTVLAGEKALPEIISRLKGYRLAAPLFRLPGASRISRTAYRWFAGRRYRIAAILSHLAGGGKAARSARNGDREACKGTVSVVLEEDMAMRSSRSGTCGGNMQTRS